MKSKSNILFTALAQLLRSLWRLLMLIIYGIALGIEFCASLLVKLIGKMIR